MAQKVGEEAVETIIEATNGNDEKLVYESSDLLYHLIVLLTSKSCASRMWQKSCRCATTQNGTRSAVQQRAKVK